MRHIHRSVMALFVVGVAATSAAPAWAAPFQVTTLATDATDSGLINPWGLASSPTGPFWLGVNGSGTSELYNGAGVKQALVVTIPGDGSVTGVAFNGAAGMFQNDVFLFVSEDGTVSGWRGSLGTAAETLVIASDANVYKGAATGTVGTATYLYVANFKSASVDVFKGTSGAPSLPGAFTDPALPAGYAPFNVENVAGTLYVTYAVRDPTNDDDIAGPGNGLVDRFDLSGNFLGRLVTGGALNAPWGLALAPVGFGSVGGDLLVGNFGDGRIHAYDPITGVLRETLSDSGSVPLELDGLWALRFGNGGNGGNLGTLYFTAGPGDEEHGRFGTVTPVEAAAPIPEPATCVLVASGLFEVIRRRRAAARNPGK
jgi:uncharacterized protein (TIGR03118 family)